MNMKVTMRVGDEVHVLDNETARGFGGNEQGLEQLLQVKGMLSAVMGMIDISSSNQGKKIEMILEFDDGQYVVIGRKGKEDPNFGT